MNFMQRIKGVKTHLGFLAYGVLGVVVGWNTGEGDSLTWDTGSIQMALAAITAWTGMSFRDAMKKPS